MNTRIFVAQLIACLLLFAEKSPLVAQTTVPQSVMEKVYDEVKTPYKYGLVIAPSHNKEKMDCPTVFRKDGKWYMTYLRYDGQSGKDGRGYETWLAESDNLLQWTTLGKILSFRDGAWDENQRGGFPSLIDNTWGGSYELGAFDGKYWMTYIGGAERGYETGPLKIGVAYTSRNPSVAHEWQSFNRPVMSPDDKEAQWFENIIQYKSSVFRDETKRFGKRFVMFYNAGGVNPQNKVKAERIGIALSDNLKDWKRYENNPVFSHEEGITGDAHIQKMDDLYVMFYFGAFRADRKYKAFNTFSCSYDLVNWTDWAGEDLIVPSKDYDNLFAHKSCIVKHEGVVYHFYCAVNEHDQRGIAVAVSKPLGRSKVKFPTPQPKGRRDIVELDKDWFTVADKENSAKYDSFSVNGDWIKVDIPHNWDDYGGYRQHLHGNRHGNAWYVKEFVVPEYDAEKRFFIRFEGVGTYATVTLNGKSLGKHLGGRTSFTIDATAAVIRGGKNVLAVKAEHPAFITDMPWVCGGCSSEWGFSEGSQPMGLFRPVVMEVTDQVRIEPFGVHIWNQDQHLLHIDTEIKNYSDKEETFEFVSKLNDDNGVAVFRLSDTITLRPGETRIVRQVSPRLKNVRLWSQEDPYLYRLASVIKRNGKTTDEVTTPYGIRTISWPVTRKDSNPTFQLNGESVFLNGTAEYEHRFGQSHAFDKEEIRARVKQVKQAGFNAFRDAHQPHNLLYLEAWDKEGMLFWPQFSAHIWYDTPRFRENFKQLLRRWIKERRNSPSVIMWGLQNESVLPKEFAEECVAIIREMDPTASVQRPIVTCNGGQGTDWNIVQNWSGTYGGNLANYGNELKEQLLNGEYGAWRSIDFHTEGDFDQEGAWSEDRMSLLMEQKIKLAESVRESAIGQFQWIFNSHDNPGRRHPDEGYRVIDKVGPVNYKGLLTTWGEPLDVYYMYRANYASGATDPMVYIVSHTWNDRWTEPGKKSGIRVFSNCEEVELFNDVKSLSLGRKKNGGKGTHFVWNDVDIRYNVLYAVGYVDGKPVAEDCIVLDHLAQSPHFELLYEKSIGAPETEEADHGAYLYRVNCGGDDYLDAYGRKWSADVARTATDGWGSVSWTNDYDSIHPYQGSQRYTKDPIKGTRDWDLFGTFRYGRQKLAYHFPVPDGRYRVELYFIEPWYGTGGNKDCEGFRVFDVAINDSVYIHDLDIWAEVGHDALYKQVIDAEIIGGELKISFPRVKAGQAVISAIAIASLQEGNATAKSPVSQKGKMKPVAAGKENRPKVILPKGWSWSNIARVEKTPLESLPAGDDGRKATIYPVEEATIDGTTQKSEVRNRTSIVFSKEEKGKITWNIATGVANVYAFRFSYMNTSGEVKKVRFRLIGPDGTVLKDDSITFPLANEKWRTLNTSTGGYINAGNYKVELSAENMKGLGFNSLTVQ